MPDPLLRLGGRLLPWFLVAATVAIGLVIIRPFTDVPVGFDTQASVAYFERLVAGQRLEQALTTTPKPLITLTHGLLHVGTDWRPIVWATLLVHGAAAGLVGLLAARAAGLAAGMAAGLAVAGMPLLIEDSAFGNAVPWALLGWAAAGVLLARERPRPVLAGAALLLATLCRLETLVIVATVGLALAWARWGPWFLPGPRPVVPAPAWLAVVVPCGALPIMLLHDWLLTGDAMYWMSVSQRYSDARRESLDILGPIEQVLWFVRRYRAAWPVIPFVVLGLVVLVRRRRWGELVGLAGMAGIGAFIVLLAARGLYAPHRYAIPVDVAVALTAAVGFGSLVSALAQRVRETSGRRWAAPIVGVLGFALMLGALAALRSGPFDPGLSRVVGDTRILNENAAQVLPVLGAASPDPVDGTVRWLVPTAVRPRTAVDLGVPLSELGGLSPGLLEPADTSLVPGQVVYHDLRGDIPRGGYERIETADEVVIGPVVLRPVLVDADRGVWVYRVGAAP